MSDTPPRPVTPPARAENTDETAHRSASAGSRPEGMPAASGTDVLPRIGEYVVVRKLGEGGMGAVYLAEDTKLRRKAAIKTMKPELAARPADRDRFEREARAAAAVESDHIVPIWQVGEAADGTPFIAMPYLHGEPLDARLKRERQSPPELILKVAREVAVGLAAAHGAGLIHRDVKPANVWLEGDPAAPDAAGRVRRCKILDFGLARSVDREDAHITSSGAILGTPAYMAPEQARGERVDHRADLWSVGVMLYRMAAGRAPFRGPNAVAVLIALATETPPPASEVRPDLPPALADLIGRLMQKDANARPQSAAEVVELVRRIAQDVRASSQAVPVVVMPAPVAVPVPEANPWEEATEADENEDERTIARAPVVRDESSRGRLPWLIGGAVAGLLALAVLAAVVIRFETAEGTLVVEISDPDVEARYKSGRLVLVGADGKERYTLSPAERNKRVDAGTYQVRVEGADGLIPETSEFTLRNNGQATVRVTSGPKAVARKVDPPKKDAKPAGDPDRKAALYVFSIGGGVKVNDDRLEANADLGLIRAERDLPKEPFQLTVVNLWANTKVTADGLAVFKDCRNVAILWAANALLTDDGLAHFKNCESMALLNLHNTRVTDKGLAAFKGCKKLVRLGVGATTASDEGLANFKSCEGLVNLRLAATQVTDKGLEYIKGFKNLGLLQLQETRVSDDGLVWLAGCSTLTTLDLRKTNVTAAGVGRLAKSLPRCKIEWDGGVIEPKE